MDTTFPFIQRLHIHKVRHLENIDILLDEARPRHLILTGPNGCGKTSVLREIEKYVEGICNEKVFSAQQKNSQVNIHKEKIKNLEQKMASATTQKEKSDFSLQINNTKNIINHFERSAAEFSSISLLISDAITLKEAYKNANFTCIAFNARRTSNISTVSGAQKLDLPTVSKIEVNANTPGSRFLQFLVNQQNRAALLQMKGDANGVAKIQAWLANITARFRQLFQNDQLTLEYDIDNFDFIIHIPGREPFRMVDNQLSDGFSAILHVVAELLMRMEAAGNHDYNMPGIVLIDEIETHLHIKLQKAILPFLTGFFPNIQFIVTTHSPFVLTSLPDAVVFDLESHERWENMSPMSASSVVEHYFDLDLYSDTIKHHMTRLQALTGRARSPDEETEYQQLCAQLDNLREEQAPELISHYRALRAKEAAQ